MRRSLLTAIRACLLSLFVLGGPGLPLIDAALWHGSGTEQVAGTRLDTQAAPRAHADVCALAAPLPVPGPVPCVVSTLAAFRTVERAVAEAAPLPYVSLPSFDSSQPRAPPVTSA